MQLLKSIYLPALNTHFQLTDTGRVMIYFVPVAESILLLSDFDYYHQSSQLLKLCAAYFPTMTMQQFNLLKRSFDKVLAYDPGGGRFV